jgi:predicted TPR repeat methyltransferase
VLHPGQAAVSFYKSPFKSQPMPNPTISPAILISPVEDGYVAYDPVQDNLHQLNPMAALLTELCDGSRSVADIQDVVAPLLPEDQIGEVDRWVQEGIKAGLLVWEGAASSARELSAPELQKLTKRLRELGKVQTAYICGKKTVALEPENWDAWYDLGEISQCVGRREEARSAYQKYFTAHPEDGEIEHLLIALRDDAPPPRASDRAILHIYKTFAASYETRMLDDLKYAGPQRVEDGIKAVIGDRGALRVLDLGCGSGLSGVMIKPRAASLTGIDLSPEMLELARARNIYDRLEQGEITEWLGREDTPFDLVMSCDCLIYFGDLGPIVQAAAKRLVPGGIFAMSMERGTRDPYFLTDTGRYTHHPDHVRAVAAGAGLTVAYINEAFLRFEYGDEVMGLYAILQKPV